MVIYQLKNTVNNTFPKTMVLFLKISQLINMRPNVNKTNKLKSKLKI